MNDSDPVDPTLKISQRSIERVLTLAGSERAYSNAGSDDQSVASGGSNASKSN